MRRPLQCSNRSLSFCLFMKTTQFGSLHPLRSLVDAQADSVQVAPVILPVAPQGQGQDIEPERPVKPPLRGTSLYADVYCAPFVNAPRVRGIAENEPGLTLDSSSAICHI